MNDIIITFDNLLKAFKKNDNDMEISYLTSVKQLKQILNIIHYNIIYEQPEIFFELHRILARNFCYSLSIRFTVQYNLFAGTILTLGTDEQISLIQNNSIIGSFGLTEEMAGVNSGLIIKTTAVWNGNGFFLKTEKNNPKYWISQGLTSDYIIVFANLYIKDKNYGIHVFLVKLYNNDGNLNDGIIIEEMKEKTICNGLDNIKIHFNISIPKESLLSKYMTIENNKYILKNKNYNFLFVAQRLLIGRFSIAIGSLEFYNVLLDKMNNEFFTREVYIIKNNKKILKDIPHIKNLLIKSKKNIVKYNIFLKNLEKNICILLKNKEFFTQDIIENISIAKIICTEYPLKMIPLLKQKLGSQSLIKSNNLNNEMDIFYMCAFAEGSNELLKQKLTRDACLNLIKNPIYTLLYYPDIFQLIKLVLQINIYNDKLKIWFDNYDNIILYSNKIIKSKL